MNITARRFSQPVLPPTNTLWQTRPQRHRESVGGKSLKAKKQTKVRARPKKIIKHFRKTWCIVFLSRWRWVNEKWKQRGWMEMCVDLFGHYEASNDNVNLSLALYFIMLSSPACWATLLVQIHVTYSRNLLFKECSASHTSSCLLTAFVV